MDPAPAPLPLDAQAFAVPAFTGVLDFCSNFHPSPVFGYRTVEAAYQAAKTTDSAVRARIRAAPTPGQAKRLGRGIALRSGWEEMKLDVMRTLVREKFSRYHALAERLLATGDVELVERNYWRDTFWGICGGRGENHLGRILMDLRSELRAAAEVSPPLRRRG